MQIKVASGLIKKYLEYRGWWALTTVFKTIYVLPEHINNKELIAHEMVHVEQINRDGMILWTLKQIYYLIRYGYKNSPHEIEARNKAGL